MPEVVELNFGVEAHDRLERFIAVRLQDSTHMRMRHVKGILRLVVTHLHSDFLSDADILRKLNVEGFGSVETERLGRLTRQVLHRNDAHANQVAAVNALVALRDHSAHALRKYFF